MPRTNSGMRYNKTKTRNGKQYMTCWMVEVPNKNGSGTHWYGKIVDSTGKVIALNCSGQKQSFPSRRTGELKTYLPVDVSVYKMGANGYGNGMMI